MPNFIIKDLATNAPIPVGNLADQINALTVVRREDVRDAHWELFLHTTAGGTVKVDLMQAGYRVLFGANLIVGNGASSERLTLGVPQTLGQVIAAVQVVGNARGDWSGTDAYNCQDFVLAFMRHIGLSNTQMFPYELRRKATKFYPPAITERIGGVLTTRY